MFLFNKDSIFLLEPNINKIVDYKFNEISKIPVWNRSFKFATNNKNEELEKLANGKNLIIDLDGKSINYDKKFLFFNQYHQINEKPVWQINLDVNKYIAGDIEDSNIVRVFNYNKKINELKYIKYLLISNKYELKEKNVFEMDSVINLPESLYLLELLLRGNIDLISDKNLKEQLELFDISCIDSFSLDKLYELDKYGIIDINKEQIDRKIKHSEKILKLIK